jgi:hypothetical protein
MDIKKVRVPIPSGNEARGDPLLDALVKNRGLLYPAIESVGGRAGTLEYGLGVDLRDTEITDAGLKALAGESRLFDLQLGPRMTEAALEHLHGLYLLQRLALPEIRISGDGLRHLVRMRNLVELSCYGCKFTGESISHLPLLPILKILILSEAEVPNDGLRFFERLPKLQRLYLSGSTVTDAGLEHLARCHSLKLLEYDGKGITASGVEAFRRALPECEIVKWD